MLQNATTLMKSAPWPPNISVEHVSCTAPATRNASLQVLFKRPARAIVFENVTKPTQNHILTSKSAPGTMCFAHCYCEIAPQRRALCRSELPKVLRGSGVLSEAELLCTFWLGNVLRPQRCALFQISTSKSAPRLRCFVHYMLCTTTAHTFLTSQLPKMLRTQGAFSFLTSKRASRRNGMQFFISHPASWLRTCRFSELTFRPSGATNHWKNTVSRDFSTFSRTCIFFLLTLSLLWSSLFSLLWLFPSLLFHLSILSEVWLLSFLR